MTPTHLREMRTGVRGGIVLFRFVHKRLQSFSDARYYFAAKKLMDARTLNEKK